MSARAARRPRLRGLLISLLVTAAVLLGGDWLVARVVEAEAGRRLQQSLALGSRPVIDLGGWPMVTAGLLSGSVSSARVEAEKVPIEIDGRWIDLRQVVAEGTGLAYKAGVVTAERVTGSALLDYAQLSELAGTTLLAGDDGRVVASYQVEVLSQEVEIEVSALPVLLVDSQQVDLRDLEVSVADLQLPPGPVRAAAEAVVRPIDVGIPLTLRWSDLVVTPEGLELLVEAESLVVALDG